MATAIWHRSYEPGVPESILPADEPFHAAFLAAAAEAPGLRALESLSRVFSFAELEALSARVMTSLLEEGLSSGEPVLCALAPGAVPLAVLLGTLRAGGLAVPIRPCRDEVDNAVRVLKPRIVFAHPSLAAELDSEAATTGRRLVCVDPAAGAPLTVRMLSRLARWPRPHAPQPAARRWEAWLSRGAAQAPPPDANAPAAIFPSKGPLRRWPRFDHRELCAGAAQLAAWATDTVPGHDCWLVLRPHWTSLGFVIMMGLTGRLRVRATVLTRYRASDVLEALRHLRPTAVVSDGGTLAAVLAASRPTDALRRSVRAWIVDGPVDEPVRQTAAERLGIAFCPALGHSLVAGLACCSPINGRRVAGSAGVPLPDVEARVVGSSGTPMGIGQWGRLEMRGPNFARRGWVELAPRARIDAHGFVHVADAVRRQDPA